MRVPSIAKKKAGSILARLTEAEKDLMWHMEHRYQPEADSLGGDPVLRRLKDDEVFRTSSANRNTITAMEERGSEVVRAESKEPKENPRFVVTNISRARNGFMSKFTVNEGTWRTALRNYTMAWRLAVPVAPTSGPISSVCC